MFRLLFGREDESIENLLIEISAGESVVVFDQFTDRFIQIFFRFYFHHLKHLFESVNVRFCFRTVFRESVP